MKLKENYIYTTIKQHKRRVNIVIMQYLTARRMEEVWNRKYKYSNQRSATYPSKLLKMPMRTTKRAYDATILI